MVKFSLKKLPFFYGWTLVGVAFITMGVCFGLWYSFSVFFVAIIHEFHWERNAVAGIFSLFAIVYSVAAVVVGTLLDRFGPRLILPVGCLLIALGLFASGRINALWQLYITYGFITALGVCTIGHISHSIFLANWFQHKRGLAFGIAMAGIGVGMFLLVPFTQWTIDRSGWRNAYRVLAAIILFLVLPLNALLQRNGPGDVGALPDGIQGKEITQTHPLIDARSSQKGISAAAPVFSKALFSWGFWLLFAAYLLMAAAVQGSLIHQVAYLEDKGFSAEKGAFFFGLVGIIGSGGKILFGYLSDRTGRCRALILSIGCAFVGVLCLLAVDRNSNSLLYGYTIFFGLGYGAAPPLMAAYAADLFHGKHFGRIFGFLSIGIGLGAALGAWASGKIYDTTQSYRIALSMAATSFALVIFLFWVGIRGLEGQQPTGLSYSKKDIFDKEGCEE